MKGEDKKSETRECKREWGSVEGRKRKYYLLLSDK